MDTNEPYIISTNQEINETTNNMISTTKYKWTNFISKIMIEQFSKTANMYFLIIVLLQTISIISISMNKPIQLLPLLFVVIVIRCVYVVACRLGTFI